ncbi:MAG: sulfite reductase subunit alpha [Akkermansiaceae bacterium]|nr:sulfite reductase subunit alpha [Akkermansiaceae bacterium]MCP5546601.1 sulfite reductase subunit alpha [Akkermansiaceae bacterium]
MATPIQLPDDAPFTPEQRAWLNDFLSKALGAGFTPSTGPTVPVTVLFGSQTGTAEGLAKKLSKTLGKGAFEVETHDLATYDTSRLVAEKNLLVIVSTYGDGEPPDSAADFHAWLMGPSAPRLEGVSYSVLALGDSSYPEFCKCGRDIDERFAALGATALHERVDVDVDADEPYAVWTKAVIARLSPGGGAVSSAAAAETIEHDGYSKHNPFPAALVENRNLNGPGAKQTHHVALSLEGSGLEYQVGDALGVFPVNRADLVDEILANLPFKPGEVTAPDGSEIPLREALLHHYDIGALNKALVQKWQARSGSPRLRALVEAEDKQAWESFCHGRELIDLVIDFPADFPDSDEFVSVLRKLQPRLYSISSCPLAHPGEVHLTVGVVRYHTYGRERGGVCSTYLADRLAEGETPRVFLHTNPAFRPPADGGIPVIMVGPGTGIAPFRAFLEHRRATGATGRNWLLFGNPHQASDFLYREELEAFLADGTLQRLDLAWSRDQAEKIYVQHLMLQQGAEIWAWLQDGASFYVCGDASRMAKDVDAALHRIAVEHGGLGEEDATTFLAGLRKDKRYQRDVY